MGPVYATRLVIFTNADQEPESEFRKAIRICHNWLSMVGERFETPVDENPFQNFEFRNTEVGTLFSYSFLESDKGLAWQATGVHPFESVLRNRQMRFEIQARYPGGGELVITIRLLLGSTVDSIRPVTYKLRPPRLVAELISAFPDLVSSGNMRATTVADRPDAPEILKLCQHIVNPDRLVPIIVISRDENQALSISDRSVDQLAREVAGLARVYVLPTFESAFYLTNFFSKKLSCFLGAIRIYWPGFSLQDSPYQHPLFTKARISDERISRDLAQILFSTVSEVSSTAISADHEVARLFHAESIRVQEEQTLALLERLNESSQARSEADEVVENLLSESAEAISRLSDEVTQLQSDQNLLIQEIDTLTDQLAQQRIYNDTLQYQIKSSQDPADVTNLLVRATSCKSVIDAVNLVQHVADEDYLLFLPSALDSARDHFFGGDLALVLGMLFTIQRVARRYHLGDPLGHKALFEDEGEADFKANVSDTARTQYRSTYERWYTVDSKRERILLGPHLKQGVGVPSNTVAAYWYVDQQRRRYVIGHVGRHLEGKRAT